MNLLWPLKEARYWWGNRRSALTTVKVLEELGIRPVCLVDFGANNSQWTQYLVERWPGMLVHSFEPLPMCRPLGEVHHLALSDKEEVLNFIVAGKGSLASAEGTLRVPAVRFDSREVKLLYPAVLKVDCENMTLQALQGCGQRLAEFAAVLVEFWNGLDHPNVEIYDVMIRAGFLKAMVTDAMVWPRNVEVSDVLFVR